eukprot:2846427-Rhodomonas_salina.1
MLEQRKAGAKKGGRAGEYFVEVVCGIALLQRLSRLLHHTLVSIGTNRSSRVCDERVIHTLVSMTRAD